MTVSVRDVFPPLFVCDKRNSTGGDSKFSCNFDMRLARPASCANRPDLVLGQFGHRAFFSALMSIFAHHVGAIVRRGSEKQMIDVYAPRNVAAVADDHARRDRPVLSDPSKSVCVHPKVSCSDLPVSFACYAALPKLTPRFRRFARVTIECLLRCHPSPSGSSSRAGVACAHNPTSLSFNHNEKIGVDKW